MAMLNTHNTLTDDPAKLGSKPSDAANEQPSQATPAAKKPQQPKIKSKPVNSGSGQPADDNAKPDESEERKAKRNDAAPANKPKAANAAKSTKAEQVLKKLRLTKGATIEMLMEVTGWQAHSVRGFLSAVVKKKMKLTLANEVGKDGARRYRIDDKAKPE